MALRGGVVRTGDVGGGGLAAAAGGAGRRRPARWRLGPRPLPSRPASRHHCPLQEPPRQLSRPLQICKSMFRFQINLGVLTNYLHPILQRQLRDYRIFVVEQVWRDEECGNLAARLRRARR